MNRFNDKFIEQLKGFEYLSNSVPAIQLWSHHISKHLFRAQKSLSIPFSSHKGFDVSAVIKLFKAKVFRLCNSVFNWDVFLLGAFQLLRVRVLLCVPGSIHIYTPLAGS
uniref:Uncharacterized protein n=1 Tax=Micrurus lemniscatus lemniscatus TaxID=129467 RepID=A0A2D4HTC6_MICLE